MQKPAVFRVIFDSLRFGPPRAATVGGVTRLVHPAAARAEARLGNPNSSASEPLVVELDAGENCGMANAAAVELVGRQAEWPRIRDFVAGFDQDAGALVIQGEAGIGKTALWRAALEEAEHHGVRVLATRCAETEMPLALGGIGDLLERRLAEVADKLPEPQRRALAVTIGAEAAPAEPPNQLTVPRAFLAYLRALADHSGVLVAVDDAQWLDPASRRVLAFAAKRVGGAPIRFLATQRGNTGDALELRASFDERFDSIRVGPLSIGALHHLIRTRLGVRIPRATVVRVHQASGGNPMFALEFAKVAGNAAGPLPLPDSLDELVRERVARLPSDLLPLLAAVAAAERPTTLLLETVVGNADALLTAAVGEGVVSVGSHDAARFTHPLLASATYAAVPPPTRRELHARLAAASSGSEQRARHLALAAAAPDDDVAQALDEGAAHARARGAPDAAAELARQAVRLSPPTDRTRREERVIVAARYLIDAGQIADARRILDELLAGPITGAPRARALLDKAATEADYERIARLAEEALEHAEADPRLRVLALLVTVVCRLEQGDVAASEEIGRQALAEAEELGDPATLATALAHVGYACDFGGHPEPALFERAVALGARRSPIGRFTPPGIPLALLRLWAGELPAAREVIEAELDAAYTDADESHTQVVRRLMVALEWLEGNWDSAERRLEEHKQAVFDGDDRSAELHSLWQQALFAASRGRVEEARALAQETMRAAEEDELPLFVVIGRWILGFLALSLDQPADAWESLRLVPVTDHPRHIWFLPDAIEAAVASDHLDEAEATLASVERRARTREHRWALTAAERCRAVLRLARGDSSSALAAAEDAAAGFDALGFPLDRGRALLLAGDALRRLGERRQAATRLEAAKQVFTDLGAPLWVERADKELRRATPRPRKDHELTAAERRVAALVADGRTNREVAAQLFTTVGTVEVHLTRIYRKLDLRSRTDLARRVADGTVDIA
jgi:DNA-binding CsgD family transcriptional regulator